MILTGVTINLVLESDGIITKAKEAKEKQKVAEITETLELSKIPVAIDNENDVSIKDYLDYIQSEEKINSKISKIERVDQDNCYITIEDNYEFLLKKEDNGNLDIIYQGKVEKTEETEAPSVTLGDATGTGINSMCSFTVGISVTLTDDDSGVNTTNSKYIWNDTNTLIGTTSELWNSATSIGETSKTITKNVTTLGIWYLHILGVDNIGNKTEVVSKAVNVEANYHNHTSSCNTTTTVECTGGTKSSAGTCTFYDHAHMKNDAQRYNAHSHTIYRCNNCGGEWESCPGVSGVGLYAGKTWNCGGGENHKTYSKTTQTCGKSTTTIENYTMTYIEE